MGYHSRYNAIRHNLADNFIDLAARQDLLVGTALELFDGVVDFAAADATSRILQSSQVQSPVRVEIDLEGGLFIAEQSSTEKYTKLRTALASLVLDASGYTVVQNTFLRRTGTYLASQIFQVDALKTGSIFADREPQDTLSNYELVGIQSGDQDTLSLEIISNTLSSNTIGQNSLRPAERGLGLSPQGLVSHRIHETLDLMAGFAGLRS